MAVDRCRRIYLKDHLICLSTARTKTRNTKVVDDSFAFLGDQCDHTGFRRLYDGSAKKTVKI